MHLNFQSNINSLLTQLMNPQSRRQNLNGYLLSFTQMQESYGEGGLGKVYAGNPNLFNEALRQIPQNPASLRQGLVRAADGSTNLDKQALCYALAIYHGEKSNTIYTKLHAILRERDCSSTAINKLERLARRHCSVCKVNSSLIMSSQVYTKPWSDSDNFCLDCKNAFEKLNASNKQAFDQLYTDKANGLSALHSELTAELKEACNDVIIGAMQKARATFPSAFPSTLFSNRHCPELRTMLSQASTQTILIPNEHHQVIKGLIIETMRPPHRKGVCRFRETTASANQVARANLTVSQTLIPNNYICSMNSYSGLTPTPKPNSRVSLSSDPAIRNYMVDHPFLIDPFNWPRDGSRSPFEVINHFVQTLRLPTTSENWLQDLEYISDPQVMPIPIHKSRTTGNYWIFGWHATRDFQKYDDRGDIQGLARNGFKEAFCNPGLYGKGFYLAVEACKSLQYANFCHPDPAQRRSLLFCAANLGKTPLIITKSRLNREECHAYGSCGRIVLQHKKDRDETDPSTDDMQFHYEFVTHIPPTVLLEIKAV